MNQHTIGPWQFHFTSRGNEVVDFSTGGPGASIAFVAGPGAESSEGARRSTIEKGRLLAAAPDLLAALEGLLGPAEARSIPEDKRSAHARLLADRIVAARSAIAKAKETP